ncbi:MAG: YIP1 family protein [Nitrospirae bacterium]|nr:YIP1 family protein [Nitrospirota bacterium]
MDLKNLFKRKSKDKPEPAEEFSFDAPGEGVLDSPEAAGGDFDFQGGAHAGKSSGKQDDDFGFQAEGADDIPGGFDYSDEPRKSTGSTSFFGYFGKGVRMALFKGDVVDEVAADEGAFGPALFIYMFPYFLLGLLLVAGIHMFTGMAADGGAGAPLELAILADIVKKASFGIVIGLLLAAFLGSLLGVGLIHLVAKVLKGEGRFLDFYQAVGVGSLVSWLWFVPFIGLWQLAVIVFVTSRVHNMSIGKAVAVVLLPAVIFFALGIAFAIMIPMMMGGGV